MKKSKKFFVPKKIVSGGQTGVDRGGLEVAIALGMQHGGWCPAGRLSEDGTVPSRYELTECDSAEYPVRTKQNVIDSDATLILYEQKLKGGTLLTRRICQTQQKPCLVIRLDHKTVDVRETTIVQTQTWLNEHSPKVLNVAGPRESNYPGIQERSLHFLLSVLAPQRTRNANK